MELPKSSFDLLIQLIYEKIVNMPLFKLFFSNCSLITTFKIGFRLFNNHKKPYISSRLDRIDPFIQFFFMD